MTHDEFSDTPLTPEECVAIRRILRDDDRARWIKGQARIWATWLVGAPVALWAAYDALTKLIAGMTK